MTQLPARGPEELARALRDRASRLTGEQWERNATRFMMQEAAETMERLLARVADLEDAARVTDALLVKQTEKCQALADRLAGLK